MNLKTILCAAVALSTLAAAPANAADYVFDVDYSGSGNATLAGGSDNPVGTEFASGDTFTYRLSATNGGFWTTLASGSIFPFFALSGNYGAVGITYALNLNNNAASVFSFGLATSVCCAHLGTNTISFDGGLVYDQYELVATINSIDAGNFTSSLLPYPGIGPEEYSPQFISYTAGNGAVPEPATWAMLILGFGLVGGAMRRRTSKVTASRMALSYS